MYGDEKTPSLMKKLHSEDDIKVTSGREWSASPCGKLLIWLGQIFSATWIRSLFCVS
jgi:hypothetical protein